MMQKLPQRAQTSPVRASVGTALMEPRVKDIGRRPLPCVLSKEHSALLDLAGPPSGAGAAHCSCNRLLFIQTCCCAGRSLCLWSARSRDPVWTRRVHGLPTKYRHFPVTFPCIWGCFEECACWDYFTQSLFLHFWLNVQRFWDVLIASLFLLSLNSHVEICQKYCMYSRIYAGLCRGETAVWGGKQRQRGRIILFPRQKANKPRFKTALVPCCWYLTCPCSTTNTHSRKCRFCASLLT